MKRIFPLLLLIICLLCNSDKEIITKREDTIKPMNTLLILDSMENVN